VREGERESIPFSIVRPGTFPNFETNLNLFYSNQLHLEAKGQTRRFSSRIAERRWRQVNKIPAFPQQEIEAVSSCDCPRKGSRSTKSKQAIVESTGTKRYCDMTISDDGFFPVPPIPVGAAPPPPPLPPPVHLNRNSTTVPPPPPPPVAPSAAFTQRRSSITSKEPQSHNIKRVPDGSAVDRVRNMNCVYTKELSEVLCKTWAS